MTRIDGWPEALFEYVQSKTLTPFEWGVHDCATFAAGAILSITGELLFTPAYTDVFGAKAFELSVGGFTAYLSNLFGEPIAPLQVQRGDIGLLILEDRELLSVVIGSQVVAPGENHLMYYPITMLSKAWRVG